MRRPSSIRTRLRMAPLVVVVASIGLAAAACQAGPSPATPLPSAGTSDRPREVNLVLRDYSFAPDPVDLVPGETVRLQVVNAGLDLHEAIVGDQAVQDAWEIAEGAAVGAPPGSTPTVSVPAELAGLRVVVPSGGRVDVVWTVPADPLDVARLIVGCHLPGHYAKGMQAAVRVAPSSSAGGRT